MSEGGYTLSEVLVALMILGLAISGLTQAVHVIGRAQMAAVHHLNEDSVRRRTSFSLQQLAATAGPFDSSVGTQFVGTPKNFSFPCESTPQACGATLDPNNRVSILKVLSASSSVAIALPADARFSYRGDLSLSEVWPPIKDRHERLQSISVVSDSGLVASADLPVDQRADCQFDAIAQSCRAAAQ